MDRYDRQIASLREHPELIPAEWQRGEGLFDFVRDEYDTESCGCLTMIRTGPYYAYRNGEIDYDLTEEIRNDERIPNSGDDITVDTLEVFAEWQRRLDAELRGATDAQD